MLKLMFSKTNEEIAKKYIKSITELHTDKTLCIYHRLSPYNIDTGVLLGSQ